MSLPWNEAQLYQILSIITAIDIIIIIIIISLIAFPIVVATNSTFNPYCSIRKAQYSATSPTLLLCVKSTQRR
jgi:hypothetical protein